MNWGEFKEAAPEMAQLGEERFERSGLILLGSVRADGSPRISPVEPLIVDGEFLLGMIWQSRKALDLLRDPRCLVHSTVSDRSGEEGEFKLRGRALDVQDAEMRERYCAGLFEKIGWRPQEPYHLFSVDIESAAFVAYEESSGEQSLKVWRPGRYNEARRRVS